MFYCYKILKWIVLCTSHFVLCFLQALCLLKIPRRWIAAQKDKTCNVARQSTRYCLMLIYIVYSLQKEANRTYNCENLGLREIPDTLPNMTEFLEFGFNFLPTIQNTTFSRLINLVFLDLTRYVCEVLCVCVCVFDVILRSKCSLHSNCLQDLLWGTRTTCLFCMFPMKYFYTGKI